MSAAGGVCGIGRRAALAAVPALVAAVVLVLALGASSAVAGKKVDRLLPVDGVSGGLGGQFNEPRGVAVHHASGDVFVVDDANHRVQRFSAAGEFERAWGWDVVQDGGAGDLDPDGFEVCTVAAECQAGSAGSAADGPAGEFDNPQGVAIDQVAGAVYVHDRDNQRVQQFDLDGAFVRMWGWDVVDPGGVAVFEVCAVAAECKQGVAGSAAGQLGATSVAGTGIAVAPVSAPNAGDVFVGDAGNRRMLHFDPDSALAPAGVFVRAWGWGVDTGADAFEICTTDSGCQAGLPVPFVLTIPDGWFVDNQPAHVAVGLDGVVYASQQLGDFPPVSRVERFDSTQATPAALLRPSAEFPSPQVAGTLSDGHLILGQQQFGNPSPASLDEYATPAATPGLVDSHMVGAGLATNGFGENSFSGEFVVSSSSGGHRLFFLDDDGAPPPEATVDEPTNVGSDSASFSGMVDPNGFPASYRFEYSGDGGASWTPVKADESVGDGDGPVAVEDDVSGLNAGVDYQVRLVAIPGYGNTPVNSAPREFGTVSAGPDAITDPDRGAGATVVTVAGRVNPNGAETTYHFEYGTTTAYGANIPTPEASVGAGNDEVAVTAQLTGLQPATTYHYRICATNPVDTACGADRTFTTRPTPAAAAAGRAYELVSPAYKISGIGVGTSYSGPGSAAASGFGAYDGERFAAQGSWGATLLDSAFSFANDWAFAERQSDQAGWVSHSPITRGGYGQQQYRFLWVNAARDDLSLVSWDTNTGQARLFPEQEAWDEGPYGSKEVTAVSDWVGNWELFGLTDPIQDRGVRADDFGAFDGLAIAGKADVAVGSGPIGGLAGAGDPTHPAHGDLVDGASVYANDLSGGVSDTFPGTGVRTLVNVCTGQGAQRTEVPVLLAGGKLGAQPCPGGIGGRERLISDRGASLGTGPQPSPVSLKNVIAEDGSRVFFMSPDPGVDGAGGASIADSPCGAAVADACPPQLYVRQRNPDGGVVTRWLSRPRVAGQDASLLGQARFEGASEDGSRVFFRTTSPLTANDPNGAGVAPPPGGVTTGTASSNSWDLYMYEFPSGAGADPGAGTLTRISAGPAGGAVGDCNSPGIDAGDVISGPAALRFASSDGSRVYFTCAAPLGDVATPADPDRVTAPGGDPAETSEANLYLYDASQPTGPAWRFVARLPRAAGPVASLTVAACASTGARNVYALGSLAGSGGDVTITSGHGNCVRGSSDGGFVTFWTDGRLTVDDPDSVSGDMYGYDVASDTLTRLSAPQGGAGDGYTCLTGGEETGKGCFGDPGLASGTEPTQLGVVTDPANPADRVAFFQSRSRLVAEDTDDAYDVYQWRNGDLSLVSTGVSGTDGAFYRGNDRSGQNVYFATRDRLSWQDVDSVLDIYTARVGGGVVEPAPPAVCGVLADGCQGPGTGSPAGVVAGTDRPADRKASRRVRARLSLARLSRRARLRAARSGVLRLRVRTNKPGRIVVSARARVARRPVGVARKAVRVREAGRVTVRVGLSRRARRSLRSGKKLRVKVRASQRGARPRAMTVGLKRSK